MSETVRKLVQAVVICGAGVAVIWVAWPQAVRLPQVWMLVLPSVLANVLQPS